MMSEKLSQAKSNNDKLKNEIISLKAEVNKRRKVESDTTLLQAISWNNKKSYMI